MQQRTISDDIYLLGDLLGEVIRTQAGESAFALEEEVRGLAKSHRQGDPGSGDALKELIAGLSDEDASLLIRAFTSYFNLINLSEDNERIRRIRRRELATYPQARRGSIREAIRMLRDAGLTADDVQRLLERAEVRLVMTAHPTEARRRTVLEKQSRIFRVLRDLDERETRPDEAERLRQRLASTIAELWSSNEVRAFRLTVLDELQAILIHFRSTLFHVLPEIYRDIEEAVAEHYPGETIVVPPFLTFGSWVGGDRDGNPFVTPEITRQTLVMMRDSCLASIDNVLGQVAGRISVSDIVAGRSPMLDSLLAENQDRFPELAEQLAERNNDEPYRQILTYMRQRIQASRTGSLHGYVSPGELLAELRIIEAALIDQGEPLIIGGDLHDLIRLVEVFGFHYARLDLRDHALRHRQAINDIFDAVGVVSGYVELPEGAETDPTGTRNQQSAAIDFGGHQSFFGWNTGCHWHLPDRPRTDRRWASRRPANICHFWRGAAFRYPRSVALDERKPACRNRRTWGDAENRPPARTGRFAGSRGESLSHASGRTGVPGGSAIVGWRSGGHARVLRLQQGNRLSGLFLVAL